MTLYNLYNYRRITALSF